jgi:transcriptional regulator NrdR family protein
MYQLEATEVINSRRLSRRNEVWRRRKNQSGVVFTTRESVDIKQIKVAAPTGSLLPFNQGKLFLSIYKACDHLPNAEESAWFLSETVVQKLLPRLTSEATTPKTITDITHEVLHHYDKLAADKYRSYRQG